jgi:hypothetical protein
VRAPFPGIWPSAAREVRHLQPVGAICPSINHVLASDFALLPGSAKCGTEGGFALRSAAPLLGSASVLAREVRRGVRYFRTRDRQVRRDARDVVHGSDSDISLERGAGAHRVAQKCCRTAPFTHLKDARSGTSTMRSSAILRQSAPRDALVNS